MVYSLHTSNKMDTPQCEALLLLGEAFATFAFLRDRASIFSINSMTALKLHASSKVLMTTFDELYTRCFRSVYHER